MAGCNLVDRMWFASHPEDDHRIRPATAQEAAAALAAARPDFPRLLTIVRKSDGAAVTYAFRDADDIDRACSFELAGWFGDDLDKVAAASS